MRHRLALTIGSAKLPAKAGTALAIVTLPFTAIHLVPHFGGGALLHASGGYVANTHIPAYVVDAFGVASGVLSRVGAGVSSAATSITSLATNPVVAGVAVVAVVAVASYCYFHGIPAPIEAALASAGIGTATKHGFMVSITQLAVALILLGGAGYLAYRFYKNRASVRAARLLDRSNSNLTPGDAENAATEAFGEGAWAQFGAALWAWADAARVGASKGAQEAVRSAKSSLILASATAAELAVSAGNAGASAVYQAGGTGSRLASRAASWLNRLTSFVRRR